MPTTPRSGYRHGDLRTALLEAGIELARAGGPSAVVLREATRRAGVSPNAAYRHFADHRALLRAVSAHAMGQLARAMEAEQAALPDLPPEPASSARLRAVGTGYLRYARDEPGLFRTAFTAAGDLEVTDDATGDSGRTPYELLTAALDDLVDVGALPPGRRPDAEMTAWSAVHGLAVLLLDGPLRHLDVGHARRVEAQLLDHVETALLAQGPASPREPAHRAADGPTSSSSRSAAGPAR